MGSWFGRVVLNFLGALARFSWGYIWRTLFNKPKFTWSEYLHGPADPDYYDMMGHHLNNRIIGALVLVFIILPLIKIFL